MKFPAEAVIIEEQRVAFLRKSGCRKGPRVFLWNGVGTTENQQFNKGIVWQKCVSPDEFGLAHFYFLKER